MKNRFVTDAAELLPVKKYASPTTTFRPRGAAKWMREKEYYVTDLLDKAITETTRGILVNGLKTGELNARVADKIWTAFEPYLGDPTILRDGEPLSPSRLETIVRTNLTDAYNHGRMMEYTSEEMLPFLNAIRYSAILDERTTPCCAFLDGKLFDPIDPDLTDLLPPNHFNCRSIVVPVVVGEVVDEADFITPEEVGHAKELADAKFLALDSLHQEYHTPGGHGHDQQSHAGEGTGSLNMLGKTVKYSPKILQNAKVEQGPIDTWIVSGEKKIGGPYRKVSWAREALKSALGEKKYAFDPNQPRDDDGKWTDTGAAGGGVGSKFSGASSGAKWRRSAQEAYDNDPEFRAAADAIALFTQGEYAHIREIAQQQITGEFTDKYKDSSVPQWLDREMSGNPLGSFKSYFEGQDVGEGSKHTWAEGARALNEAIATSDPLSGKIFRGVYGRENIEGLKAMKPGDDFSIVGPSSFTADEEVATKFSQGRASGQGRRGGGGLARGVQSAVIEVESGARGIPVSAMSPWKQKEVISSGKFKVVGVSEKTSEAYGRGSWFKVKETRVVIRQAEVWKSNKKTFAVIKELPLITRIFGESFSDGVEE